MNTLQHNLISLLVNQKKYDAITEFCHCEYPDEKDVIVSEYCGTDIRLFTGSDGSINILCPKEMSTIQESAVTQAIENGTIFDDAESVDNTAKYLELTSLPYNAIINSGKEIPKHMHVAIGGVIGNMNDEGRCEIDDASLRNGYQCMKDMMNADTSDEQSINKIVDNYLGNPDHMSLHKKLRYDIGDLHKEIESIQDIDPEDVITDEDCCESFDEYDMDEIETESYMYDEYDEVIQEGKTPNYIRNLKKLDYDPKTNTILSNIPIPGGKPGERHRVKMMIDDDISKKYGSCVSFNRDEQGNRIGDSAILHIPRRILKSKGFNAMFTVGHELGHVMYAYDKNSGKTIMNQANAHIKQNENKLDSDNDHERDTDEYIADALSMTGYKESKGKRKIGFSGVSKQNAIKALERLVTRYCRCHSDNKKKANNEIKKLNKIISGKMSPYQSSQNIDEIYTSLSNIIGSYEKDYKALKNEIGSLDDLIFYSSFSKSTKESDLNKWKKELSKLERDAMNLKHKLDQHKLELKNIESTKMFINGISGDINDIKDSLQRFEYIGKMRADFIRKYVNEYVVEDQILDDLFVESYDEDDYDNHDEPFDESYVDYEYYDDEIFQEGKTPNYVRNLKHLDYDPKTGTILSNVPIPGGKPGEKIRVKMIIDDDESRRRGPCCTWDHDSNGNRIPGSEVLHIPRRILKAKGIEAMTVVGHELGHVNYIYYPNSNPKLREQAIEHIKQNEHKLPDKNTHERDPEEFGADTHQIVSKRKLKSGGRKVGFSGVTKSTVLRGIEKNLSRITDKRVKECKQRINQIRYMIKKMETSRGNTSSQQLQELDRKCDELTKTIKSMNDEIEYIENGISQVKGMMQNLHPEDDKNMIQDLRNLVSQQRARQFDLEDKRDELMEKLKVHYSNQNNVQPANSLIAEMNDNLKQTENLIEKIKYEVKMRTDFIRKYIKEYLTDIPENTDVYQEGLFHKKPKKLKPIPRDIVPYITVEMNAIRDSNDQAMLSGYTCSKLELVDFYLNVIDTNDERYIVPHTRQYLVQLQNDLNRLLTQILRIKPINKSDRVWQVNVNYPENWRG